MRRFEGMFLFDNAAVHDWAGMEAEVRRLCDRVGASLVTCLKFDERKLAFEIKGRKRGTYVLAYFDAPPGKITEMERDATLSEVLLRSMFISEPALSDARLAELKAWPPEQPLQPASQHDGRREERGYGRDGYGGGGGYGGGRDGGGYGGGGGRDGGGYGGGGRDGGGYGGGGRDGGGYGGGGRDGGGYGGGGRDGGGGGRDGGPDAPAE